MYAQVNLSPCLVRRNLNDYAHRSLLIFISATFFVDGDVVIKIRIIT